MLRYAESRRSMGCLTANALYVDDDTLDWNVPLYARLWRPEKSNNVIYLKCINSIFLTNPGLN
jgi:hypothetical protein